MFKTVKKEEAKVYLERLSDFYEYYDRNEDSLIVKILGVYKFVRKDI